MIYEHRDLVDEFKARMKAQNTTPLAMQHLADNHAVTKKELASVKDEPANERAANSVLRRVVAELTLDQPSPSRACRRTAGLSPRRAASHRAGDHQSGTAHPIQPRRGVVLGAT